MSVEITIDGLNAKQRVLADIIWQYEDFEDVQKFIKTLPQRERAEALSIVELMKMATLEQLYDGIAEPTDAKKVLQKYNTKRG